MATQFDAIVIGTGQAGPPLAYRLAGAGMKVAIIERGRFGGTCVNTGCIPTKAMVASAYAARMVQRAAEYGVEVAGAVRVDMARVKARRDAISGMSQTSVETGLRGLANCRVIVGHARFEAAHEVRVGEEVIAAPRIFINVGGRAVIPPIEGIETIPYLTNSTVMDVAYVPKHLIIIGGSYIGLEFSQMFRRFGSEVTVIENGPRLIGREDPDVSDAIREILEKEGVSVRLSTRCTGLTETEGQIVARLDTGELRGSDILIAVGRRPNTDDLGLNRAGIATDLRGYITVDDELKTNVDGVWAMGDCNGRGAFTHTSYNDFEIVAGNLLDNDRRHLSDRISTYGLFIDPPLGRAGMTEAEARKTGRPLLVGYRPMTMVGRAVEKGEDQGFMKVLVDAETKQILGAAILGTGGDEAIHTLLDAMYAKAPYTVVQRAMHIHPTVAELVPTMLGELKPLAEQQ